MGPQAESTFTPAGRVGQMGPLACRTLGLMLRDMTQGRFIVQYQTQEEMYATDPWVATGTPTRDGGATLSYTGELTRGVANVAGTTWAEAVVWEDAATCGRGSGILNYLSEVDDGIGIVYIPYNGEVCVATMISFSYTPPAGDILEGLEPVPFFALRFKDLSFAVSIPPVPVSEM